ncbi:MAG: ribokinase [Defluviitaleaceae bacterium]|nr:ribokinase [Defluviitaleaceae bacterium]
MQKKKIAVIGSINNDLVIEVSKPPVMGETVLGGGFARVSGGKGANQAVACARLGADVAFAGAVGDDVFGVTLRENLAADGVDVSGLKTVSDKPTGTAMIVVCNGDNYIAVDQGANLAVDRAQIDSAEERIREADMVVLQLEIPLDTVRYALERCKAYGVPALLNPAPARALEPETLALADIVTPNETEAFALTGIMPATPGEAVNAARRLAEMGAKMVVITLGENGCVYGQGAEFRHMPAVRAGETADTTAAGDTFSAALAVALTEGKTFEQAVGFAVKAGALTVTKKGAQPSIPYREDVEKLG